MLIAAAKAIMRSSSCSGLTTSCAGHDVLKVKGFGSHLLE